MDFNIKKQVLSLITVARWALGALCLAALVACDGDIQGSSEAVASSSSQLSIGSFLLPSASSTSSRFGSSTVISLPSLSSASESSSSIGNYQFGEISIEDKGLAVLDDEKFMIVGAIHGNSVRANNLWTDNLWTYTGEARLLALTATHDSTMILAIFENAVVMLNRFTGEKLGEVATPNDSASDVLLVNQQLFIAHRDSSSSRIVRYLLDDQGAQIFATLQDTQIFSGQINMEYGAGDVWVLEKGGAHSQLHRCALTEGPLACALYKTELSNSWAAEDNNQLVFSKDDRWIVTSGNNLISTTADIPLKTLPWTSGLQGFYDLRFINEQSLLAIDLSGTAVIYENVTKADTPTPVPLLKNPPPLQQLARIGGDYVAIHKNLAGAFELISVTARGYELSFDGDLDLGNLPCGPAIWVLQPNGYSLFTHGPCIADAPSLAWVEAAGWSIKTSKTYRETQSTLYVFLDEYITAQPSPNSAFTAPTLELRADKRYSRYRVSFDIKAADRPVFLTAYLSDYLMILDDSSARASGYTVIKPWPSQRLVATDWVSMSGEFDLLSADIAYLKLHAKNSEPFNLKNLILEEIGPSDVSGGVTEY